MLITRQISQNQVLAEKINSLGWATALPCPLLEIVPIIGEEDSAGIIDTLPEYDLAIFTSQNAVVTAGQFISPIQQQPKLAIAAIGTATATTLKNYNCQQVIVPTKRPFNSENLLDELKTFGFKQQAAIIFTGEQGNNLLARSLQEQSIKVTCVYCYRRDIVPDATTTLRRIANQCEIDVILITCETSLNALTAAAQACTPSLLGTSKLVVASKRIMDAALGLGWRTVYLANGASDSDMLAALKPLIYLSKFPKPSR